MKKEERIIRLNVAREIISDVHQDICNNAYLEDISKEETRELCDIIINLNEFISKLKSKKMEE